MVNMPGVEVYGTVLFCDICDYTNRCIVNGSKETLIILKSVFDEFDNNASECGVIKVGTIGDAYMTVSTELDHGNRMLQFAKKMLDSAMASKVDIRIGISTGVFVRSTFGTPGITSYYGDTVNHASRMESNGIINCVRVSIHTRIHLLIHGGFTPEDFAYCGVFTVKSYGVIPMYIMKMGQWQKGLEDAERLRMTRRSFEVPGERHSF
jgi:hypothetical protein